MKFHRAVVVATLACLVTFSSSFDSVVVAQSGGGASTLVWENDRLQVVRVTLGPGERISGDSDAGSIVVFLNAGLDGGAPPSEVAWLGPGPAVLENRGGGTFEALIVDLKGGPRPSNRVTPPEVVRGAAPSAFRESYDATARNLIVNDLVSVTKEKYGSTLSVDPWHFHPQDAVVIYLRSGYVFPTALFRGPERVRRGDVRVVPGNTVHLTGNAGSDPLEFLLIVPS